MVYLLSEISNEIRAEKIMHTVRFNKTSSGRSREYAPCKGIQFSLIPNLLFICTIFVCILQQLSSALFLTQECDTFQTLRPKYLDIRLVPMLFLLSGTMCLVKLDIFGQPLHNAHPFKPVPAIPCFLNCSS